MKHLRDLGWSEGFNLDAWFPPRDLHRARCVVSKWFLFGILGPVPRTVARLMKKQKKNSNLGAIGFARQSTDSQNISPTSTAPDSRSLRSIRCSGSTLPGNLLPMMNPLIEVAYLVSEHCSEVQDPLTGP